MPELPEMQALSERLDEVLRGAVLEDVQILGFSGLKTVVPAPKDVYGEPVVGVTRRAKYLVIAFASGTRFLIHLGQAGRLDLESPPKTTRGRGAIVRIRFEGGTALLLREYGHERRAGFWVVGDGDDGPLESLGPEPGSPAFTEYLETAEDNRRLNTILRDQHVLAGLGRGHTDDILHRATLSPFASLSSLSVEERHRLLVAIDEMLAEALVGERERDGGLSQASLGDHFIIHNRAGEPCPRCSGILERVSFASYEMVYCPTCQTKGRPLADRRLSRLLR